MWNDVDSNDTYVFEFRSGDESRFFRHSINIEEGSTWHDVHRHFIDFLSAVYGYDIQSRVTVHE